jgi:predicted nuclease of restriction endonuclease-like (RecB) superfamily
MTKRPGKKSEIVKKKEPGRFQKRSTDDFDPVINGVIELLEEARRASARAVNTLMTATYWEIGRRIAESEQKGKERAAYGEQLVERLAQELTARFGRGFSRRNVFQMRSFYLAWTETLQPSTKRLEAKTPAQIVQPVAAQFDFAALARRFPLPWTHYVQLLAVKNPLAREFYEAEALRGGWSKRQLHRQVNSLFYERAILSKNKAAMLTKGMKPRPEDAVSPEEEIKEPLVLEFLGLKDEYSESELEEGLIKHLETFLLELGNDFAFIGRQRRLRIDNEWYRIDLLFFHRRLRCLLILDLKIGQLTHADAGQMHLYLNYAREHWMVPGENPPVGLILCASKGEAVARYALEGLPNKVLAAEYRTALPDEKTLAHELKRTGEIIAARLATKKNHKKRSSS